jgi:hypothetical protein
MYKVSYISNELMWLLLNVNTAHFQPYHDENKGHEKDNQNRLFTRVRRTLVLLMMI